EKLQTVHIGHSNIRGNHARKTASDLGKSLLCRRENARRESAQFQHLRRRPAKVVIIVDENNERFTAHRYALGKVIVKQAPSSDGVNSRSPPSSRAISDEITRPRP